MSTHATAVWLPRVLFESALIVISILTALALDQWSDRRQDQALVQSALSSFVSEMKQNYFRVEDAAPFNQGLKNVLNRHYMDDDIKDVDEFVTMIESYNPITLQSTAWASALATGSLAKMDYSVVSALSLTYGLQDRYMVASANGLDAMMSPQNLADDRLKLAVYQSIRYLNKVTLMEGELSAIYLEAIAVVEGALLERED